MKFCATPQNELNLEPFNVSVYYRSSIYVMLWCRCCDLSTTHLLYMYRLYIYTMDQEKACKCHQGRWKIGSPKAETVFCNRCGIKMSMFGNLMDHRFKLHGDKKQSIAEYRSIIASGKHPYLEADSPMPTFLWYSLSLLSSIVTIYVHPGHLALCLYHQCFRKAQPQRLGWG